MQNVAFMFPGVGSHYVGMGKDFYNRYKVFKDTFDEASDVLGLDMKKLCFSPSHKLKLEKLENSQAALLSVSTAIYRMFIQEVNIMPHYYLGHSLGEYSALCCAGIIRFPDALKLVKHRGKFIQDIASSLDGTMMWVINLNTGMVDKVCNRLSRQGEEVFVSAYDSPTQSSISGIKSSVLRAARMLEEEGAIVYPLKMNGPFHSPLMKGAAENMRSILNQYLYKEPVFPVIANQNALPYKNVRNVIDNLSFQLVSPIRWQASINYLITKEVAIAVEIGPKDVLKFLIQKNSQSIRAFTLDNENDLLNFKKRMIINRKEYLSIIARCLGVATSTKNYITNHDDYQKKVVQPYRSLESMYKKLKSNGGSAYREDIREATAILDTILRNKKIPQIERQQRLSRIYEEKILPDV